MLREWNFDGLVGPTHHFGGLGVGNVASQSHRGEVANPRAAAFQGLDKMAAVAALGVPQAVLPPAVRPNLQLLRSVGFFGSESRILQAAAEGAPELLSAAYSSSFMWRANAATVSCATSSMNQSVHLTVANLCSSLHRQGEAAETYELLRSVFKFVEGCEVHAPLPPAYALRDEGAANHLHLCDDASDNGIEIFVYGDDREAGAKHSGQRMDESFGSRQGRLASQAVARLHRLRAADTFFLRQHSDAIKAGAFHNDVVATSCRDVLLFHEKAFQDADFILERIRQRYVEKTSRPLHLMMISEKELSLADAIASYFFNSQLVLHGGTGHGPMTLVCPAQCETHPAVRAVIDRLIAGENPISHVTFLPLHESMKNGGGPACLRLRVPLSDRQVKCLPPSFLWSDRLEQRLRAWVGNHYREHLTLSDLADPLLMTESLAASRELETILRLPSSD